MREIKFRAWDSTNARMIQVHSLGSRFSNEDSLSFLNCPLMQFTGLKDKNGKEIYEGDLIKMKGDTDPFSVIFTDGAFYLSHGNKSPNWRVCQDSMNRRGQEVIGNIYENPELLKEVV